MAKARNTYFVAVASTWIHGVIFWNCSSITYKCTLFHLNLSPATSLIDPRDEDYVYYGHPPVRGQQPIDYITIDDDDDSASTKATQKAGGQQKNRVL